MVSFFVELHATHQIVGQVRQADLGHRSHIADRFNIDRFHRVGHESKHMLDSHTAL